jgi:hypothetical protein
VSIKANRSTRRATHDLESDVPAHREAGQRKTRRRVNKCRLRHGAHRVVMPGLGHDAVSNVGERPYLMLENATRVQKAWQQDERRFGHQPV